MNFEYLDSNQKLDGQIKNLHYPLERKESSMNMNDVDEFIKQEKKINATNNQKLTSSNFHQHQQQPKNSVLTTWSDIHAQSSRKICSEKSIKQQRNGQENSDNLFEEYLKRRSKAVTASSNQLILKHRTVDLAEATRVSADFKSNKQTTVRILDYNSKQIQSDNQVMFQFEHNLSTKHNLHHVQQKFKRNNQNVEMDLTDSDNSALLNPRRRYTHARRVRTSKNSSSDNTNLDLLGSVEEICR